MTDIEKRAFEAYPLDGMPMKEQQDKREGYIKACKEYESLQKIHGWVARDEDCGDLYVGVKYPVRIGAPGFGAWVGFGDCIELPKEMFPEITWESEPVEVELLVRRV